MANILRKPPSSKAATGTSLRSRQWAAGNRNFVETVQLLNQIVDLEPREPRWREMRAQALVDGKNFTDALRDFDSALRLLPPDARVDRARLLSGRGLAFEGLAAWPEALKDYDEALALADAAGLLPDPYILNSRGNCHASLGEWQAARDNFLASAEGFQRASGFRYGRSTTPRLDGAVFAASNAALMLAQLGDEEAAMKEMETVARRAPGSVDMRVALAALYWRQGREAEAESMFEFACNSITAGCTKYTDPDWLYRIRRWPPVMCEYLQNFLRLRSSPAQGRRGAAP
ncbi:hypothetical protein ABPG77_005842 [Micractinium sp. CCAP 211/92]